MDIKKAQKIVHIWGVHMEYFQSKLTIIFSSQIPESFLPFPKATLEEAINIIAKHYHNMGDKEAVNTLERSAAWLSAYEDDEKAILKMIKFFNDKKMRDAILPAFKEFQDKWIKTQKI